MSETPKTSSEQYQIPQPAEPHEGDADFDNPFVGRGNTVTGESISASARAAQRFMTAEQPVITDNTDPGDSQPSQKSKRLLRAGIAVGAVAAVALPIGQAVTNEIKKDEAQQAAHAEYEAEQKTIELIHTAAHTESFGPDVPTLLTVTIPQGGDLTSEIDKAASFLEPDTIDPANVDFSKFTLLESAKAQGIVHKGDMFDVVAVDINDDGMDELIVHPSPIHSTNQ